MILNKKLSGCDAVIFDLDGTLVDSMWMWKNIDIDFLARYGHECPEDLQKAIEGMSFTETAAYFKERFSLKESLEEIKGIWTEMSIELYRSKVPLKQGALNFLEHLREKGIKAGIATSNGRKIVDTVLNALDIAHYFQIVVTACEVAAGKPAPDIYLKVAKQLDVSPQNCLVFEDIPAGIMAGKNAGMKVCAIEDEFSSHMKEEKILLADYYVKDYYDVLNDKSPLYSRRTEAGA